MNKENRVAEDNSQQRIGQGAVSNKLFFVLFYLLVFQNPLTEYVHQMFTYVDEVSAAIGFVIFIYCSLKKRVLGIRRDVAKITLPIVFFTLVGLLGNLIYQYQPIGIVLIDVYTNLKFYLMILTGYEIMRYIRPRRQQMIRHVNFVTVLLFVLLLIDIAMNIFPTAGYRYGVKERYLIFAHATHMAAACVFLLSLLLLYYDKKCIKYIIMNIILLVATLRVKALAGAAGFVIIFYLVTVKKEKIKIGHMFILLLCVVVIAWDQISFYYFELSGQSARSVMTVTSFEILRDYFPIGTGFGTYASQQAGVHYSPVYVKYGFEKYYDLRRGEGFFSDTFWPIIIGQTGFVGLCSYLVMLWRLFRNCIKTRAVSNNAYAMVMFIFLYLIISSTSESAFCNPISIPLAMLLGFAVYMKNYGTVFEKVV